MADMADMAGTRWWHKKRGTIYTVVAIAQFQGSAPLTRPVEGIPVVVYVGSDGMVWARWQPEFLDRFEPVEGTAPKTPEFA